MGQTTIGLSGHIDHGKTSIVKALTGKNTDNLKDEINRGMTIDIGFAHLNEKISLIDVPGHEKFIRNMVAGVCSIDYSLLVIAADDGIMPQTVEHFEILKLLDIKSGIIVINKIDLVDREWLDLIEIEVKAFVKNSFLENVKILKVSTITNEGISLLKKEIASLSESKINKFDRKIFRMFIDRVFTKKGFGTVVTGTVLSGLIKKGQQLEILPTSKDINIRDIHSHDNKVNQLVLGDRGAINLQSIDRFEIKRGYHLGEKDYFSLINNAIVRLNILKELSHNQRVRVHIGTQEVMARILFPNKNFNINKLALLKFENNIICSFKDKFIIRTYSPITTIGGGKILDVNVEGKWTKIKNYINKFEKNILDKDIIEEIIQADLLSIYTKDSLSKHLGISIDVLNEFINIIDGVLVIGNTNPWIFTKKQKEFIENEICSILNVFHSVNLFKKGMILEQINEKLSLPEKLLKSLLLDLCDNKKIKILNDYYSMYNFKIELSGNDIKIKNKLLDKLESEFYETSGLSDLAFFLNESENKVKNILKIADDDIVVINGSIFFTKNNYNKLLNNIDKHFKIKDTLNISEFKSITNTSRKYVVPLLEYLDKNKITYRIGNERKYNKK